MKYERLTERDKHGNADLIDADLLDVYDCVSFNRSYFEIIEAIQRLAELEDKIECGELISTVQAEQGDQEIAFFVAHNAEVRKQAIKEFADKIIDSGTTVYDPLHCTEFIKLPMERYEKLIKEGYGE